MRRLFCFCSHGLQTPLRGRVPVLWRCRGRGRRGAGSQAKWYRWGAGWRRRSSRRGESPGVECSTVRRARQWRRLSAISAAWVWLVPGSTATNSSPPKAGDMVDRRGDCRGGSARRGEGTASPPSWPCSSLMDLKWSRSRMMSERATLLTAGVLDGFGADLLEGTPIEQTGQ